MTRETLQNIFRNPYSLEVWQNLLINLFGASEIRKTPAEIESDKHDKVSGYLLGELNTTDHYRIGLFAFEVGANTHIEMNRVGLRSLVRSYTKYQYDAAISVYYNDKQWRLSFISDLKGENTAPKRFTYVFGNETENYRTAAGQLIKLYDTKPTFESIKEAFSVDKLSKDFFAGYKKQYDKFVNHIGDTKLSRDYVKKMMGRLVFLQFLQKKGWMSVPAERNDWSGGDMQYTQNLVARYKGDDKLLTNVLEVLFFDTLNTKRPNDIADPKLGDNIKIPYLNGGLFDKDTLDHKDIDFPYDYFAELVEFFSHYNFTIDENDPYDAEVGIDPEMLGHIFENLLEDNKDKGAFYTPKEIVQYMCRQSLIEYLQSKLEKHPDIEAFVNRHDVSSKYIIQNAKDIEEHLDSVKICDPAIGSGAFPMGILNEIFHCKMALDLTLDRAETKKNIIQNSIYGVDIEQGAVDIARLRFWLSLVVDESDPQPLPNLDYKIMCGNSLLSRHALDVPINEVFAEYNKGKSKEDKFTLESYKTLVANYTNSSNKEEKATFRDKIEEIKSAFKTELDKSVIKRRIKLQSEINDLKADTLFGAASKADIKLAKEKEKKLKVMLQNEADVTSNKLYADAFEWRFELPALLDDNGVFIGFDIVIGNPPYGVSIKGGYRKAMEECIGKVPDYEIYYYFIQIAHRLLTGNGILSYIIPNTYLFNTFAARYRIGLLDSWNLLEILDCSKFSLFESATVRNTINIWQKAQSNIIGYRQTKDINSFLDLIEQPQLNMTSDELLAMNQNWGLAFRLESSTLSLIKKIKDNVTIESVFSEISQGLIAYDKYQGQNSEIIANRAYHYTEYKDGLSKWLWGKDITRYSVRWNNEEYIDYCDGIANPRQPKFFKGKRILVREITNPTIFAAIATDELYNDPSVLIILESNNYSLEVVAGILNSKLATFFHFNHAPKATKGAFPKILIKDIKEFPIPAINPDEQNRFEKYVNQILDKKRENPQADTSALEAELDQMVYNLYNLTPEEITLIENK